MLSFLSCKMLLEQKHDGQYARKMNNVFSKFLDSKADESISGRKGNSISIANLTAVVLPHQPQRIETYVIEPLHSI